MTPDYSGHAYAGLSVSCTPVAWFANTLPVLQWLAIFVGIISGCVSIYKFIKTK